VPLFKQFGDAAPVHSRKWPLVQGDWPGEAAEKALARPHNFRCQKRDTKRRPKGLENRFAVPISAEDGHDGRSKREGAVHAGSPQPKLLRQENLI
jgi:hypothetical protein